VDFELRPQSLLVKRDITLAAPVARCTLNDLVPQQDVQLSWVPNAERKPPLEYIEICLEERWSEG
jgi:hypothetical protein